MKPGDTISLESLMRVYKTHSKWPHFIRIWLSKDGIMEKKKKFYCLYATFPEYTIY